MPANTIRARFIVSDKISEEWKPSNAQRRRLFNRLALDQKGHVIYVPLENKKRKKPRSDTEENSTERFRLRINKKRLSLRRLLYAWSSGSTEALFDHSSLVAPTCGNPACLAPGHQTFNPQHKSED